MKAIAIVKTECGKLIKVYEYDQEDYQVKISDSVKYPELFFSKCSGIDNAINKAEKYNGLKVNEVIFK